MENQIQVLKQTELCGQQFNVYGTVEEPLFLAKDVAEIIGYAKTGIGSYDVSRMLKTVDDEEKMIRTLFVSSKNRPVWLLTENGLYEVLMQSRKPIAKQFKKGVKLILKEIRKHGGYIATQKEDTPELIMAKALQIAQATIERKQKALTEAQATIEKQEAELKETRPKAEYFDITLQSDKTYTSTQMAKELNFVSAYAMHIWLKYNNIMFRQSHQWQLTAKYSGKGYTKVRTTVRDAKTGKYILKHRPAEIFKPTVASFTVWTEKGRKFLIEICQPRTNYLFPDGI